MVPFLRPYYIWKNITLEKTWKSKLIQNTLSVLNLGFIELGDNIHVQKLTTPIIYLESMSLIVRECVRKWQVERIGIVLWSMFVVWYIILSPFYIYWQWNGGECPNAGSTFINLHAHAKACLNYSVDPEHHIFFYLVCNFIFVVHRTVWVELKKEWVWSLTQSSRCSHLQLRLWRDASSWLRGGA